MIPFPNNDCFEVGESGTVIATEFRNGLDTWFKPAMYVMTIQDQTGDTRVCGKAIRYRGSVPYEVGDVVGQSDHLVKI